MQLIALFDVDVLNLVADDLRSPVGFFENFAGAFARLTAIDAPWWNEPAVIMDRDRACSQKTVGHVDTVTAAMQTSATAVGFGFITFDQQREIPLQKFVGHIGKARPQRVAVWSVTHWATRNAAKSDLEQLEPVTLFVITRIEDMGA